MHLSLGVSENAGEPTSPGLAQSEELVLGSMRSCSPC